MAHWIIIASGGFRHANSLFGLALDGIDLMVVISLKLSSTGRWSVARSYVTLFSDLQLESAIALAKEVAYDEHTRTRRLTCVEMPGLASTLVLQRYGDLPTDHPRADNPTTG